MARALAVAVLGVLAAAVAAQGDGAWTPSERLEARERAARYALEGDVERVAVWYRRLAERGDPWAQVVLGRSLLFVAQGGAIERMEELREDLRAGRVSPEDLDLELDRAGRSVGEAGVEAWAWTSLGARATCEELRAALPLTRIGCLRFADDASGAMSSIEGYMTAEQLERARALAQRLAAGGG